MKNLFNKIMAWHSPVKTTSLLFYIIFIVVGLLIYKDYGIPQDEVLQKKIGFVNLKYTLETFAPSMLDKFPNLAGEDKLYDFIDKDYGPVYEMATILLEQALGYESFSYEATNLRKLIIFLVFALSVLFFFKLVKDRTGSWATALAGSLVLVLSPRQFAHGFYNSKDILFLATLIFAFYNIHLMFTNPKIKYGIWAGIFIGFAASVRIIGILIPFLVIANYLYEAIILKEGFGLKKIKVYLAFGLIAILVLYISIPYLWKNPVGHFIDILQNMSKFRWPYKILYLGEYVKATELPSSYLPLWMLISTPIMYVIMFFAGLFLAVKNILAKQSLSSPSGRFDALMLAFLIIPFAYVLLTKPVLYDDWKHMYFLYVPVLFIIALFIHQALGLKNKILKYTFVFIFMANQLYLLTWMTRHHPYQYNYFNKILKEKTLTNNFGIDNSGLSYKQGLEFVAKQVPAGQTVTVACADIFGPERSNQNIHAIPGELKERLAFTFYFKDADYIIMDYKRHPEPYPFTNEVFRASIGGLRFLSVFKMSADQPRDTINMFERIYNLDIYEDIYGDFEQYYKRWSGKSETLQIEEETL